MRLILLLLLACSIYCASAENSPFSERYLLSYPQTAWEAVKTPVSWDEADWLAAAGALGVGAGLYLFDEEINRFIANNRDDVTSSFSYFGNKAGDKGLMFPASGAVILAGYLTGDKRTMDTGLLCLKSLFFSNAATYCLKLATQRERPSEEKGSEFWGPGGFSFNRDSFPSGHAAVAWSVAPVLVLQYPEEPWLAPVAYGIAALTSYARLHENKHWASDVFAGAIVGWVSAQLTLKSTPRLQFYPLEGLKGLGLSCSF